ncbi:hypothetical protein CW751_08275 [Brumimicrobium salinarum]|uniref:Secretion system C-terminal sorting domain-containing protein n=1 Tax=Brumimicrobium salinarum TaxID=2058658 RepID=A0A2I0R2G3_9FLAO|nr:T9SS type A sorting domain-containing protein [Brumimicrobium salinarum]PKR80757.1 hypothetical protein CW751_08275 [Brumimicrobium salinarum]
MKRNLLFGFSLIIGLSASAQFTDANKPVQGDGTTLYLIDESAPNMATEVGSGAVWDYSTYAGYNDDARNLTVFDASSTAEAALYPISVEALEVEGLTMSYSISSAAERLSQGFVFSEPNLGDVIVQFDSVDATTHVYPMGLGDAVVDSFIGHASFNFNGAQNVLVLGELHAKVDGQGTLKLANNDYTNVLRYSLIDTIVMKDVSTGFMGTIDVNIYRAQYEYYDLANNSLPLFVHTTIIVAPEGGVISPTENKLVLSLDNPAANVGLVKNELEQTVIYPNPAKGVMNIDLPSNVEKADIKITDAAGRHIDAYTNVNGPLKVSTSSYQQGVYLIHISNDMFKTTKSIVVE